MKCTLLTCINKYSTLGGANGSALELAKKLDYKEIYYFLNGFAGLKSNQGIYFERKIRSIITNILGPSVILPPLAHSNSAPTSPTASSPPLNSSSSSTSSSNSSLSNLPHSSSQGSLSSESSIRAKKQVNSMSFLLLFIIFFYIIYKQQTHNSFAGEVYPHSFQLTQFSSLTWCAYCGYFVWGIRRQGYVCFGNYHFIIFVIVY